MKNACEGEARILILAGMALASSMDFVLQAFINFSRKNAMQEEIFLFQGPAK